MSLCGLNSALPVVKKLFCTCLHACTFVRDCDDSMCQLLLKGVLGFIKKTCIAMETAAWHLRESSPFFKPDLQWKRPLTPIACSLLFCCVFSTGCVTSFVSQFKNNTLSFASSRCHLSIKTYKLLELEIRKD